MITKIKTIKNFAIFNDFDWDKSVRDTGGNKIDFKRLNIIYGRNYSGKTTLSRIMRSLEKGFVNEQYKNSEFSICNEDNSVLNNNNLSNCEYTVRVYNKDFVSENLKWLFNHEGEIKSFAILGEKNIKIEDNIKNLKSELGDDIKVGLLFELQLEKNKLSKIEKDEAEKRSLLENKLRKKAKEDIKENSIYNDVNYNIVKIKEDIKTIKNNSIILLCEKDINLKKELLKERPKENIDIISIPIFSFENLYQKTKNLILKEIKPTKSIQDLLNNSLLQEWVRNGIYHHKEKRDKCAFCGENIPKDLWEILDSHFSVEYEELRNDIVQHITNINNEKNKLKGISKPQKIDFYANFHEEIEELTKLLNNEISRYDSILEETIILLENKKNDIFNTTKLENSIDYVDIIVDLYKSINKIITDNNLKTNTLNFEQNKARNDLRLYEVTAFLSIIDYDRESNEIDKMYDDIYEKKEIIKSLQKGIKEKEENINLLQNELKDERKGAEKVNYYLNHFFGSDSLKLDAIEHENKAGYNFRIMRGDSPAYNLSEGECTLISFCYFMARLEDIETKDKDLVIWIDDPISSLDNSHIFFIFSLIESVITKPVKIENKQNSYKYKQLFISTHNLDFLKYLKKISVPRKITKIENEKQKSENDISFFLIERNENNSKMKEMPEYLKNYTTEFNYLFHQIYKCGNEETIEHDCFYNFGNNLRKFLESYLYYKYPCNIDLTDKIDKFFGDATSTALINRVHNEFSHLGEMFDRSTKPIDIPEIQKIAKCLLNRIEITDKPQYDALIKSIGIKKKTKI